MITKERQSLLERHERVEKWCKKNIRVGDVVTIRGLSGGYKRIVGVDRKNRTVMTVTTKAKNDGPYRSFVDGSRFSAHPLKMKSIHYVERNRVFSSVNTLAKEAPHDA